MRRAPKRLVPVHPKRVLYRRNPNPAVWKGEPGRIHIKGGCWDAEQHWDRWEDTELTPENHSLLCKNCDR